MSLPDPQRSSAVLIGSASYRSGEIADLPAVYNNLTELAAVLTDSAFGSFALQRCTTIRDPSDVRATFRTLRDHAKATEDTLMVYFAGHGLTGTRNELFLGLTDTDPNELSVSALPFELVREVFAECPARNRILVLDCCFSGRAIQDMGGAQGTILGQVGIAGSYTLASVPANAVALAPVGARYTTFTGELLRLLATGIPDGPPLLTFGDIYRWLLQTSTTRGLPHPQRRGTGTVDLLALARNRAYTPPGGTPPSRPATIPVAPPVPVASIVPMEVRGILGSVAFDGNWVTITKRGHGPSMTGQRRIQLSEIEQILTKPASLLHHGYIQFTVAGVRPSPIIKLGVAAGRPHREDPHSISFAAGANQQMAQFRKLIDEARFSSLRGPQAWRSRTDERPTSPDTVSQDSSTAHVPVWTVSAASRSGGAVGEIPTDTVFPMAATGVVAATRARTAWHHRPFWPWTGRVVLWLWTLFFTVGETVAIAATATDTWGSHSVAYQVGGNLFYGIPFAGLATWSAIDARRLWKRSRASEPLSPASPTIDHRPGGG